MSDSLNDNDNNQADLPSGDQEMSDEFWKKLSEKTGIAFPLSFFTKSHGRMGKIFPKLSKPQPEARITKGRAGSSKIRQPKQQRASKVRLRMEGPVQEDPFARKPRGGVSKLREEVPEVLEQLPGRKSNLVLKDRDGCSQVKSFREDKKDEISTQRSTPPQVSKLRNPEPKPEPEIIERQHQGDGIIRIPGQIDPKNPNLRTDPPVHQEFGRDWEHEEWWTPDWIRHHTYNDYDRIRYGRLIALERNPNLDGKGHGQIRYELDDNPYFTTDVGHYWKGQEKEPFMDIAERLAKKHVPDAKSWADIEGGPFFLNRFQGNRTLCYSYKIRRWWKPQLEGIKLLHTGRMLDGVRADQFDVSFVLHFTKKYPVDLDCLFAVTRLAVVLVYPYEWKQGTPDQIGVNEEWLGATIRRRPTAHQVVEGRLRKGVVIYRKV